MINGWLRKGLLVVVLAGGVILGRIDGAAPAGGGLPEPRAQQSQSQLNKDIFDAIRSWLTEAHVAQQDMPKRLISVERTGSGRYKVHMEMVQGQGWFEVWKEGQSWRVKGLPVPGPGGGGGGGGGA